MPKCQNAKMPHCWKFIVPAQMSLLVCVAVQKKLNFDLLTLSTGSWGGGGGRRGGGTRGVSQQFFRHITASHTLLGKLS